MSGAAFTRADVRDAKRTALAWLGEQATAQRESAGGATEAAYAELAREFDRRSGYKPREHPRHPDQMAMQYPQEDRDATSDDQADDGQAGQAAGP